MTQREDLIKERLGRYLKTGDLGGLLPSTMERYGREAKRRFPDWYAQIKNETKVFGSGKKIAYGEASKRIFEDKSIESIIYSPDSSRTVKQLAEYSEIDLNEYKAVEIITNRWNMTEDYVCWQFKVKWRPIYKKDDISPYKAVELFKELMKDVKVPNLGTIYCPKNGHTLEINIPDLHLGQLSWGAETGNPDKGNYDIHIARDEYLKAINYYYDVYKGKDIKKILLPLGNDFFNVASALNETMNGTAQDEDDRGKKTFTYGLNILIESVLMLNQIAPVELIQIPGNHDGEKIFYLMTALYYAFQSNPSIEVDLNPADRKYRKIGNTLLGLGHGKTKGKSISLSNLGLIMADEAPQLWATTKYREFHIGHIHHEKQISSGLVDEFRGVMVRAVPSLSQIDYWHHSSGYRSTRSAHCYEYDDERGLINLAIYHAD